MALQHLAQQLQHQIPVKQVLHGHVALAVGQALEHVGEYLLIVLLVLVSFPFPLLVLVVVSLGVRLWGSQGSRGQGVRGSGGQAGGNG